MRHAVRPPPRVDHPYIAGAYPNDFATWVVLQVRDRVLGEKLAECTPSAEKTLEDLRMEIVETIDAHLEEIKSVPAVVKGLPFYFMQSKIIDVPTKK